MTTIRKRAAGLFMLAGAILIAVASLWTGPLNQPNPFCNPTSKVSEHLMAVGFEEGDFIVNPSPDQIPEGSEAYTRGGGSFNESGVYTTDQLLEFYNSDSANAQAFRSTIDERLAGRTVDWTWVYFPNAVNIEGNLGVQNGGVVDFGTRESGAGELVAFPVNRANCEVVQGLIVRAGCANPGFRVVPVCKEEDCTPPPPPEMCPWNPDLPKDHPGCLQPKVEEDSVTPPPGVTPEVDPGEPEPERPGLPVNPAPVQSPTPAPTSTSQAPGANPNPSPSGTPAPTIPQAPAEGTEIVIP